MTSQESDSLEADERCQHSASECQLLRDRLEIAMQYLQSFNLYYHAHGLDYTPQPWGITVQSLIHVLESDKPIEALDHAHAKSKRPRS